MSLSIPLISPSWPKWGWDKSNGSATQAQTEAAYQALVDMSLTTDFSYKVWNDLVDAVHDVLTEAGLTWDNTYTTYANARLAGRGRLTAAMFNSVAMNIVKPFDGHWVWEYNQTVPLYAPFNEDGAKGYTGRAAFVGISQADKAINADTVFGWYLYELARRLNVLIDELADNADWAKLDQEQIIEIIAEALLTPDPSKSLAYDADLVSHAQDMRLSKPPARGLKHDGEAAYYRLRFTILHKLAADKSQAAQHIKKVKWDVIGYHDMPKTRSAFLETYYETFTFAMASVFGLSVADVSKLELTDTAALTANIERLFCAAAISVLLALCDTVQIGTAHDFLCLVANAAVLTAVSSLIPIIINGPKELTAPTSTLLRFTELFGINTNDTNDATTAKGLKLSVSNIAVLLDVALSIILTAPNAGKLTVNVADGLPDSVDAVVSSKPTTAFFLSLRELFSENALVDLDTQTIIYPWYDPIQTGSNIYIRSVADPVQTGSNVYIGRE